MRAAKWMTESIGYFLNTPLTASRFVKSTFSKGISFPTIFSIRRTASVEELRRLSRMTTLYPSSINSTVYGAISIGARMGINTVCEPIYPVPPVNRTYFPFLASADMFTRVERTKNERRKSRYYDTYFKIFFGSVARRKNTTFMSPLFKASFRSRPQPIIARVPTTTAH